MFYPMITQFKAWFFEVVLKGLALVPSPLEMFGGLWDPCRLIIGWYLGVTDL